MAIIAQYNDNNLPGSRDAAKEFYEWARNEAKKKGKDSVISSYNKSSSSKSYILQYYNTWGELLEDARKNALAEKVTEKEIKDIDFKILKPEEYAKQQAAAEKKKKEAEAAAKAEADRKAAEEKANRKSNDPKFIDWIKTQYHDPDDEISNLKKLTLKYVVPSGIKTWGDWYEYAGIETPVKPKEKPKEKTPEQKAADLAMQGRAEYFYGGGQAAQEAANPSAYTVGVGIYQAKQYLDKAKPGTKEYEQYLAAYRGGLDKLNEINAKDAAKRKELNAKDAAEKRKGLVEALQRAKDYGTPKQQTDAQAALDKFDQVNPAAATAPDSGTKTKAPKPTLGTYQKDNITYDSKTNKPYQGQWVWNNPDDKKTYVYQLENGQIKTGTTYQVYQPNGTVKTYDPFNGDKEVKTSGTTTAPTTSGTTTAPTTSGATTSGATTSGVTAPTTSGVTSTPAKSTVTKDGTVIAPGDSDKTTWVSYLKATFKSLEDPAMKKEITTLINRANKFNMTEKQFLAELEGTAWYKSTYPSVAKFFIESHDPRKAAAFAEKVENNVQGVTSKLESLGIRINDVDPTTGKVIDNSELIKGIALQQMENGWDDNDLNEYLATRSDVLFTGGGTVGSSFESIKRQASLYGVSIDKNFEKEINLSLLDTRDLRDANYWLTEMRQQAYDNPMYKAFAPSMKENNRTLYEVTNSYRKQMADLLEVDPTQITWKDLMDKAVDSTTGNARTFADFTKSLKKDPMWQYTKNAKETYSGMALDIAKMFGFMG